MVSITNRKTAREAVATGLDGAATSAQAVLDYVPNNLSDSGSPVITVSSWSQDTRFQAGGHVDNDFELIVTVWVLRFDKDAGNDYSAAAEDELDTVSKEVIEYFTTHSTAEIIQPSQTDYAMVDSIQYRTESHFIRYEHYQGE